MIILIITQGIQYLSQQEILDNKMYPLCCVNGTKGIKDLILELENNLKYVCRHRRKKIEKYVNAALLQKKLTFELLRENDKKLKTS